MSRKISYYFEPIAGLSGVDDIPGLIALHIESFEKLGWEVMHLDESIARKHPLFDVFDDPTSVFGISRNGWEYTRACYMRWLAYATAGNYFADFDIINYDLTLEDALSIRELAGGPTFLSGAGASGLFEGEEYEEILNAFLDYKAAPFVRGELKDDVNDMTILQECRPDLFALISQDDRRIARDYTCPGWDVASLVHYPYHYTKPPRAKTVVEARPISGAGLSIATAAQAAPAIDAFPMSEEAGPPPEAYVARPHLLRADIINEILRLFKDPSYLEVGVWQGDTFRAIEAKRKVGVDPKFEFDASSSPGISYFEMTSNSYFADSKTGEDTFDVIFLDGLHTFEQTLTDLMHAVDRLTPNGVIVIDDVLPNSYPASMRTEAECYYFRQATGDANTHWMGDVYRLVFFINAYMLNWSFATVAETHGQVVMWQSPRSQAFPEQQTVAKIAGKTYSDSVMERDVFNVRVFDEILATIKRKHPAA